MILLKSSGIPSGRKSLNANGHALRLQVHRTDVEEELPLPEHSMSRSTTSKSKLKHPRKRPNYFHEQRTGSYYI